MNILGLALKDALPVKVRLLPTKAALHPAKDEADLTSAPDQIALTKFKGIGDSMSTHICRRLQFHDGLRVSQLTEAQQNKLTAFLSDPSSVPYTSTPVAAVKGINNGAPAVPTQQKFDPLKDLIIESDLRREVRANIAHHRNIVRFVSLSASGSARPLAHMWLFRPDRALSEAGGMLKGILFAASEPRLMLPQPSVSTG